MAEISFERENITRAGVEHLAAQLSGRDGLAWGAIQRSHARLRDYADRYDVEPIIDSLEVPRDGAAFRPDAGEIDLRWRWTHPAAEFFEYGTVGHEVNGDPILSFIWEDAPAEVRAMFPHTERKGGDPRVFFRSVEVAGIEETRYAREGIGWLRSELRGRFS